MYEIVNGLAHIAMLILVLYVLAFIVVPALAIGIGGIIGLGWVQRRIPGWVGRAIPLPRRGLALLDRGLFLAVWPIITITSLWRGIKAVGRSLSRQTRADDL